MTYNITDRWRLVSAIAVHLFQLILAVGLILLLVLATIHGAEYLADWTRKVY